MTRRELAAALAPMADGDEALEAKLICETFPTEEGRQAALSRRLRGEPLQYILGEWEFMGLPFFVGPQALIPRPDTETLCEAALAFLQDKPRARVLDLCCGSGCIGVSLGKLAGAEVTFADISPKALALAEQNARRNGVFGTFIESDMFAHIPGTFDLIACNPPYLTQEEMQKLQREVTFEPALALFGGADGLDLYRRLAADWQDHVAPGGALFMEIGYTQGPAVQNLFPGSRVLKDYGHRDRVVCVKKL